MWRSRYEDKQLVEKVDKLWDEVKPLYDELHTYVRNKLLKIYPDKLSKSDPNIPAHIFGNMWAQNWVHLYDRTKPYTGGASLDVSDKIRETMSVFKMFEKSDEFYQSLGLPSSDMSYGEKAMITRPDDGREVQCHASAWGEL
jgi:peptidyl-dipeptidase A